MNYTIINTKRFSIASIGRSFSLILFISKYFEQVGTNDYEDASLSSH